MRLTVQLFTLRDPLSSDWKGTLAALRQIGLEYVELAGDYGKSAAEWRETLDELGLKASGAHIGLDKLEGDLDSVIADAKTLGMDYIIVPWISAEEYKDGWTAFGKRLQPIGEKIHDAGLTLCYHNHDFEYANGDGLAELYAATTHEALKAEIDAAWVSLGGQDPETVINGMAGRVPLVHGKDYDKSKSPQWTPAGQGSMDLAKVVAAAEAAGVEFIAIELDESPGAPLDAVAESYAYYSGMGLR